MLRQTHQQRLSQKLSPQQIQLMKLLQIPTTQLEERIKEELEENPALEIDTIINKEDLFESTKEGQDDEFDQDKAVELEEVDTEKIEIDDYLKNEQDGSGDLGDDYYQSKDAQERSTIPVSVESSYHEVLMNQLAMLNLNAHQQSVAEQIIGSIDDDGYLRRSVEAIVDDLAFSRNIISNETEVKELLHEIKQFEPIGTGAVDLRECLILQLEHVKDASKETLLALKILQVYFDDFIKKHYDKIKKALAISDKELKSIIDIIIKLNPKPGAAYYIVNKVHHHITPDFFIDNSEQRMELRLNSKNAPPLRISEGFTELLQAYNQNEKADKKQREAVQFIKQKLDAAKWFIDAIRQRQQTLIKCMQAIIFFQNDFFKTGDESKLKPMILKDIAEITQLDMSTISRVANSKYVQTEFGTFQLKYFFSEAITNNEGEEVTNKEVRNVLAEIIENEDKSNPYNDDVLTELIAQKGFKIARRTVGKYREHMNIPPARLRKQL